MVQHHPPNPKETVKKIALKFRKKKHKKIFKRKRDSPLDTQNAHCSDAEAQESDALAQEGSDSKISEIIQQNSKFKKIRLSYSSQKGRFLTSSCSIKEGEEIFREAVTLLSVEHHGRSYCYDCQSICDLREESERDGDETGEGGVNDTLLTCDCDSMKSYLNTIGSLCRVIISQRERISSKDWKNFERTARVLFEMKNGSHSNMCSILELYAKEVDASEKQRRIEVARMMVESMGEEYKQFQSLIPSIIGVATTNQYHIDVNGHYCSATYLVASMFEHSCEPNCRWSYAGPKSSIVIEACKPIKPGESLSIAYTSRYGDLTSRRRRLKQGWNFDCFCPKCERELAEQHTSSSKSPDTTSNSSKSLQTFILNETRRTGSNFFPPPPPSPRPHSPFSLIPPPPLPAALANIASEPVPPVW